MTHEVLQSKSGLAAEAVVRLSAGRPSDRDDVPACDGERTAGELTDQPSIIFGPRSLVFCGPWSMEFRRAPESAPPALACDA